LTGTGKTAGTLALGVLRASGKAVWVLQGLAGLAVWIWASRCGVGKEQGMRVGVVCLARLVGVGVVNGVLQDILIMEQQVIGSLGAAVLGAAEMGRLAVAMAGSKEWYCSLQRC
jgi:hypothetical protein